MRSEKRILLIIITLLVSACGSGGEDPAQQRPPVENPSEPGLQTPIPGATPTAPPGATTTPPSPVNLNSKSSPFDGDTAQLESENYQMNVALGGSFSIGALDSKSGRYNLSSINIVEESNSR